MKLNIQNRLAAMTLVLALTLPVLAGCGASGGTSASPSGNPTVSETVSSQIASPNEPSTDTASQENSSSDTVPVRVAALKGPTAMGMVKLMDDAARGPQDGNDYNFTIAGAVDEITPKLVKGDVDISAVPANLASVLYNNTGGKVRVLAVNTLGVLYIVESGNTVHSVADLKGKTIYASGKGATPEYALNYLLSANGIDPEKDVTIEYKAEHTECVAALTAQPDGIAMLPQPFVTTAQMKNDKIRIALDMNKEWEASEAAAGKSGALITGVVVARADFVDAHPEAVNAFLDQYRASVSYVNGSLDDASTLMEKYEIVPAAVAKKALPFCNITFVEGAEMKEKLSGYLSILMEQNPKSIGGALPDDAFYYSR